MDIIQSILSFFFFLNKQTKPFTLPDHCYPVAEMLHPILN